ncbi:hypothetical protein BKA81DRAFT_218583 [Phyllosticta paracitricarpa]
MDHDHHLSQSITQHLLALMRRAHQSSVEDGQTIGLLAHALAQLRDELAERNETIREARERIQALESQTALQAQKIDELEERSETQPGETLEAYAELLDDDAACDRDEHGEEEEEEEEEVEDSRRGCRGTVEPEVSVKRIIRDQDQTTTELLVQLHVGIGQQSERRKPSLSHPPPSPQPLPGL